MSGVINPRSQNFARRDWEQAWSALSAADATQPLDANALEDLAMAAFWTGPH